MHLLKAQFLTFVLPSLYSLSACSRQRVFINAQPP